MPSLSEVFNLDPDVERLTFLPRLRGSLPSEKSVMMPDRYMPDIIAPKILYDFIRAIKAPARAARGEVLNEEEALNVATNLFGGGLTTSGSVPLGSLGMSARTKPAGTIPLREVPRSPLGFYSKVEEATLPLQNKGSGGQFLAQIQKTPGVKPEEIEVLGLDKFLQSKPTVTKQEIQDYITANKPDVQEVRLGDASAYGLDDMWKGAEAARTKFGSYTIPGGENYRELLLTLPAKNPEFDPADLSRLTELSNKTRTAEETAEYRALASRYDASLRGETTPEYRSSHFEQPNILTHLRANDRVIDGKKALFIEEIQSDWHQAGRKKGYKGAFTDLPEGYQVVEKQRKDAPYYEVYNPQGTQVGGGYNRQGAINGVINELNDTVGGVPDAPFKKSWHELALKRAIQEAVDKGYDKLAFTTGKTQAERYDLSKQVNKIDVEAVEEVPNLYFVDVDVAGRGKMNLEVENGVVRQGEFEGKPLEDVVGKEIAEKVFAVQQGQTTRLQGDDLRIGGEGMKGFYDEILPKALQNLTKKYGTKVTKTTMKAGQDVTEPGIVAPGVGMEFAGKTTKAPEVEVWSMDITPQMREQIKAKGQPLFVTAPPLGLAEQDNDPLHQFLGLTPTASSVDPLLMFVGPLGK